MKLTLSVIKADVGSIGGHAVTTAVMPANTTRSRPRRPRTPRLRIVPPLDRHPDGTAPQDLRPWLRRWFRADTHSMPSTEVIQDFLAQHRLAFVGASHDPKEFSATVYREDLLAPQRALRTQRLGGIRRRISASVHQGAACLQTARVRPEHTQCPLCICG